MLLGAVLTVVFTAANIYLGLKVGLTFASSIPAAVISMAVLRRCRGANILENNMVQTQASAAGTLSAIIFILPGLLMIGHWQGFPFWLTAAVCGVGGLLGVLYTIPLRRVMVVDSPLPYPEGVAAAEILRVGELAREKDNGEAVAQGQAQAREIAFGGLLAALAPFFPAVFACSPKASPPGSRSGQLRCACRWAFRSRSSAPAISSAWRRGWRSCWDSSSPGA